MELNEARRAPGSEWIKNHPRFLEFVYAISKKMLARFYPFFNRLAPGLTTRIMIGSEKVLKGWVFNCQMCGHCVLHSTGMTCPMNCPKNLRNGPCGGVRTNGNCEVIPDMPCVWVQAWERSQKMKVYSNDLLILQPPVNRSLKNTSAWINLLEDREVEGIISWQATTKAAQDS